MTDSFKENTGNPYELLAVPRDLQASGDTIEAVILTAGELLSKLRLKDLSASRKRTHVTMFREALLESLGNCNFQESVIEIIRILETLRNSQDGIELYTMIEDEDIFDLTEPTIVIGLMLYNSKYSINDEARRSILNKIIEMMSDRDIAQLLTAVEEYESVLPNASEALARDLLSLTMEECDIIGVAPDHEIQGPIYFDRSYEEIFKGSLTEDFNKVFTSINAYSADLAWELLRELVHNFKKSRGKPYGIWLKSATFFESIMKGLVDRETVEQDRLLTRGRITHVTGTDKQLESTQTTKESAVDKCNEIANATKVVLKLFNEQRITQEDFQSLASLLDIENSGDIQQEATREVQGLFWAVVHSSTFIAYEIGADRYSSILLDKLLEKINVLNDVATAIYSSCPEMLGEVGNILEKIDEFSEVAEELQLQDIEPSYEDEWIDDIEI